MTKRLPPVVVPVIAVLLLAPGHALAASEGGELREVIFQAINLLLVAGLIVYFARKPVLEYFATRRNDIKRDLDSAAQLLAEAETRNAEIQRRLADLESQIEETHDTSRRRADEECERILAEARTAAERIRNDARAAAQQELSRARTALRVEAADLSAKLAADLLREHVRDSDRDRLLDEFITRVESGSGPTA